MTRLEELQAKRAGIRSGADEIISQAEKITNESYRVADVAHNAPIIIKNLDEEFEAQTKLRGKDIGFLFFATALQCVRQYCLADFKERMNDQEAAKNTKGHNEEHSDRNHRYYNPSLEEIITNPVPFDTIYGAPAIGSDISRYGGHRYTTLGHDPILGWIFGTANIATSTLTDYKFKSYHIFTGMTKDGKARDMLANHADTKKVLSYSFDKLANQGNHGKLIIGTSLVKEAVHLKSDIGTADSLPIPIISTFDPELASALADYGIDMENVLTVSKQMALASIINLLIAMIHRLTYNPDKDGNLKLYEVKTRKILDYSNVIASVSNILVVALGTAVGTATKNEGIVKKSLSKLDIGGIAVTLYRLVADHAFIQELKQEFILNNFDRLIQGDM